MWLDKEIGKGIVRDSSKALSHVQIAGRLLRNLKPAVLAIAINELRRRCQGWRLAAWKRVCRTSQGGGL